MKEVKEEYRTTDKPVTDILIIDENKIKDYFEKYKECGRENGLFILIYDFLGRDFFPKEDKKLAWDESNKYVGRLKLNFDKDCLLPMIINKSKRLTVKKYFDKLIKENKEI